MSMGPTDPERFRAEVERRLRNLETARRTTQTLVSTHRHDGELSRPATAVWSPLAAGLERTVVVEADHAYRITASVTAGHNGGAGTARLALLRDGTVIQMLNWGYAPGGYLSGTTITVVDRPPVGGTVTYDLRYSQEVGILTVYASLSYPLQLTVEALGR